MILQPVPLELLRLGQFDEPPENRKEKNEDRGILDSLRSHYRPQYPFTVYHAGAKAQRRYTLYTNTEASRKKWHEALVEKSGSVHYNGDKVRRAILFTLVNWP